MLIKTTPSTKHRVSESGSVLIYIFVAVLLFAALSFTVSQTNQGGGSKQNEELIQLHATEILQYSNGLQRAVRSMRIDGLDFSELSFENNFVAGYENPSCNDDSCKIFHINGGGMSYQAPLENDWIDKSNNGQPFYGEWYFPGEVCVLDVGSDTGAGCNSDSISNEEVIVILPWIKKVLCEKINQELGITNKGDPIPVETTLNAWNGDNRKFDGNTGDGERMDQGGRRYGCFEGNGTNTPPAGTYHFFQVLWAR